MKGNLVKKVKQMVVEDRDKSINRKNKKLMMDKILSYSPELLEGIEKYKDANRNFMLLIFLSVILINFPLVSMPCCIIAVIFLVKMLQFIKYRNINSIVNILGKDIVYKGIYDKGKIQGMLEDFKDRYGDNIMEYDKLVYMVGRYEAFITKIEDVISKITIPESSSNDEPLVEAVNVSASDYVDKGRIKNRVKDYYKDINDKFSLTYKNEDGEIKKINRAIEFFEDDKKKGQKSGTVVLKSNRRGDESKLKVYLYKKSSDLQNDAL